MIPKIKRIRKRSTRQTIFFSALIGILVLSVIGFLTFSSFKITQRKAELITKIESLRKEIQILEEKNQELRAGIEKTQSENYWEGKIRKQGYKKPGEEQVVVLPPEESQEEKMVETQSLLERLAELVKKLKIYLRQ